MSLINERKNIIAIEKNINKLKHGFIINNYKVLCSILEWQEVAGSMRTAQLNILKRYVNYDREGHKFIISNIYNHPLPKIDGNIKRSDYRCIGVCMLLAVLEKRSENTENIIYMTKRDIMFSLGLVNPNYQKFFNKELPDCFCDMENTALIYMLDTNLQSYVDRILSTIVDNGFVMFGRTYFIKNEDSQDREATAEELLIIKNWYDQLENEKGIKKYQLNRRHGKREYYNQFKKEYCFRFYEKIKFYPQKYIKEMLIIAIQDFNLSREIVTKINLNSIVRIKLTSSLKKYVENYSFNDDSLGIMFLDLMNNGKTTFSKNYLDNSDKNIEKIIQFFVSIQDHDKEAINQ